MELRLFAYGTLKRGLPAHARHCTGAQRIVRAWLRGCLFEHANGYPVLVVPRRRIRATGTRDAAADALATPGAQAAMRGHGSRDVAVLRGCVRRIDGELITFPADGVRLAALDRYEGYSPERPSLFVRVLVQVNVAWGEAPVGAWTYIAGPLMDPASLVAWNSSGWRPHPPTNPRMP